jgi:hypothetical protein
MSKGKPKRADQQGQTVYLYVRDSRELPGPKETGARESCVSQAIKLEIPK